MDGDGVVFIDVIPVFESSVTAFADAAATSIIDAIPVVADTAIAPGRAIRNVRDTLSACVT